VSAFAGQSTSLNHSIAGGFDYVVRPNLLTDFRFGFFRYQVHVVPNGLETSPAKDAGIPGVNLDTTFTGGMPAFFINDYGNNLFKFGYALGVNGCNCPLIMNEKQVQFVNNWSKIHAELEGVVALPTSARLVICASPAISIAPDNFLS